MEPGTVKLIQLIVAELLGATLIFAGIFLFYRGVSGAMTLIVEGPGVKAKLVNGSPGAVVALLGVVLVFTSLSVNVTRQTHTEQIDNGAILDEWLSNAGRVTGEESFNELVAAIVGDDSTRFFERTVILPASSSLGGVAGTEYGQPRYWRLVAAINAFRDYYDFATASSDTRLDSGSVLSVWKVSKFNRRTTSEIIQIKVADAKAVYDHLLTLRFQGLAFGTDVTFEELSDSLKLEEVQLSMAPADLSGGVETVGDLALKWFDGKHYWPLITWTNPDAFAGREVDQETPIPRDETLLLLRVILPM